MSATNVLVTQTNVEPEETWTAVDWPEQTTPTVGATREQAENAYLAFRQLERESVRFWGPLMITGYIVAGSEPNTVKIFADADQRYEVERPNEAEAKAAFIELWNTTYVTGWGAKWGAQPVTDDNVDWQAG